MITSGTTTSRSEVVAEGGVVACGHAAVARVGIEELERGGNAIDAAVAGAFAAFVAEPALCGPGGHGRMSLHLAEAGETIGIDHFIRAPAQATPEMYQAALRERVEAGREGSLTGINTTGHLSVGIPGAVAGLWEAHQRYGSRPWAALVAPAIELAEAGTPVDWRLTVAIASRAAEIRLYPEAAEALLRGGLPPRPETVYQRGDRLDQRDLARTLKLIADDGPQAFYRGPIAQAIEQEMATQGGLLAAADLAGYAPSVFAQPKYRYREREYVTCGDLIGVEALNLLERFDLALLGADSVGYRHLMAEALGQAFVDSFAYAADPHAAGSRMTQLASKAYAARLAAAWSLERARPEIAPGDLLASELNIAPIDPPAPFAGTTSICVADRKGNFVSLIIHSSITLTTACRCKPPWKRRACTRRGMGWM